MFVAPVLKLSRAGTTCEHEAHIVIAPCRRHQLHEEAVVLVGMRHCRIHDHWAVPECIATAQIISRRDVRGRRSVEAVRHHHDAPDRLMLPWDTDELPVDVGKYLPRS